MIYKDTALSNIETINRLSFYTLVKLTESSKLLNQLTNEIKMKSD